MDKLQERSKTMAKVIDFYIPDSFHQRVQRTPSEQRGEVIEIRVKQTTDPDETSELIALMPS